MRRAKTSETRLFPSPRARGGEAGGKGNVMMWGNGGWGWAGWLLMSVSMVVFWTLVGYGIYWLVRASQKSSEHTHGPDADDILADRFARGEISAEEYQERKKGTDAA